MAGAAKAGVAIGVSEAGGLGSLACAMLSHEQVRSEIGIFRERTNKPINMNFFCHTQPIRDERREAAWRARYNSGTGIECLRCADWDGISFLPGINGVCSAPASVEGGTRR
jgi:NAD(P)H-dependent flavin oxidoreductase YrpB (nitropropane dioxygenase family)